MKKNCDKRVPIGEIKKIKSLDFGKKESQRKKILEKSHKNLISSGGKRSPIGEDNINQKKQYKTNEEIKNKCIKIIRNLEDYTALEKGIIISRLYECMKDSFKMLGMELIKKEKTKTYNQWTDKQITRMAIKLNNESE